MGKVSAAMLGAIVGGFAAVGAMVWFFGWGMPADVLEPYVRVTRADYVDLLLTLVTILLAAIGLGVTVGAVVIGLVALKTLREIKDEASTEARTVAGTTVAAELKVGLPTALQSALLEDDLGHRILTEMAQRGELDEVLERVATRMQSGGPEDENEPEPDEEGEG